ncbi:serine hydrolase domain-containing protein [Candidatus Similichlamydia epinepheli]|uniref:serine hydrolase domain-containing protein n=1 Tax=Candidatus Similichlamydia epinepheli TaxID=1903953 RepID=UPI000D3CD7E0|nr:serine hydrolase domain-containing protein [Candidatus Similichlamydia epinepheli]
MVDRLRGVIAIDRDILLSQAIEGEQTDKKIALFSQNFFSRKKESLFSLPRNFSRTATLVGTSSNKKIETMYTTALRSFASSVSRLNEVSIVSQLDVNPDTFAYAVVWKDNQTLFEGSWGKDGSGDAIDSGSIFRIGSLSKHIVADMFFNLGNEKGIKWSQRLSDFFPDNFPPSFQEVTLFHLFNHQSGLPSYDEDQSPSTVLSETLFKKGVQNELQFSPGNYFFYSNYGYAIIGRFFEQILGSSFEDEVRKHSKKMSLFSTGYLSQQQEQKWVVGHKKSSSHEVIYEAGQSLHQTKAFSAAGLYSCARDLRNWYTLFLSGDLGYSPSFLFKNVEAKVRFLSNPAENISYHSGFFLNDPYLEHTGFFPGYLSQVVLNSVERAGILILCGNQDADIISMKKELQFQFKDLFNG